ncbi:DNA-binding protein [Shewanella sp. GXUN23E]|uniref:DNA-binding protein n=1 Tax=Shewanella sp. GXUN23E TaxID=3422498 RepID=UPI003D7C5F8D
MQSQFLICIDDTDDIGTKGTGEIAGEIGDLLMQIYGGRAGLVSRHQLYVHPDIPYTSHNSAMCFAYTGDVVLADIRAVAANHLVAESAAAADPGLAIMALNGFSGRDELIAFGHAAKQEVKTKAQAYTLAQALGIDLTEHGGTGQGVIGALAGLGLRLEGRDGRVKGQIRLGQTDDTAVVLPVGEILAQTGLDAVVDLCGNRLDDKESVTLLGKVKAIVYEGEFALLVAPEAGVWRNASRSELKGY